MTRIQNSIAPDSLALAMTTAPRPLVTIHGTISSLRRAGFHSRLHVFAEPNCQVPLQPGVELHRNEQKLGMWPNWVRTARFLLDNTAAPFLMIMEDDFETAHCAAGELSRLIAASDPSRFGIASLYTPSYAVPLTPPPDGWIALSSRNYAWGSQAYCFSRRSLAELLTTTVVSNHSGSEGTDAIVNEAIRELKREIYCHIPSLSSHTGGDFSTVDHQAGGPAYAFRYDQRWSFSSPRTERPRRGLSRACVLVPYFAKWPEWMPEFLKTCCWNGHIDWLFFTDQLLRSNRPPNVRFITIGKEELLDHAEATLRAKVDYAISPDFKELRPQFSNVFHDYIDGYEFVGWTDLDILYGDLTCDVARGWHDGNISLPHQSKAIHFHLARKATVARAGSAPLDSPASYGAETNKSGSSPVPSWKWKEGRLVNLHNNLHRVPSVHRAHVTRHFPLSEVRGFKTFATPLPPVQSLWIGNRLTRLETLTIESFLVQGHAFHLYTYEPIEKIPTGVVIKDAEAILPRSMAMSLSQGKLAGAADLFRYQLLAKLGGWWVDMDMLCLRPLPFVEEHLFAWEDEQHVNNAIIHAPPGSRLMEEAFRRASEPNMASNPPKSGPHLVTAMLREQGKLNYARPSSEFYPVHWSEVKKLVRRHCLIPRDSYTIHAWHGMWASAGLDATAPFPVASILGQIEREVQHKRVQNGFPEAISHGENVNAVQT